MSLFKLDLDYILVIYCIDDYKLRGT